MSLMEVARPGCGRDVSHETPARAEERREDRTGLRCQGDADPVPTVTREG